MAVKWPKLFKGAPLIQDWLDTQSRSRNQPKLSFTFRLNNEIEGNMGMQAQSAFKITWSQHALPVGSVVAMPPQSLTPCLCASVSVIMYAPVECAAHAWSRVYSVQ